MEDEDLLDAITLSIPDGMGGTLWKPSRLEDIQDLPYRTWQLFLAYRSGSSARSMPWRWWVIGTRLRHQFRQTFSGYPEGDARCGVKAEWDMASFDEQPGVSPCTACDRLNSGQPAQFGSIGD